MPTPVVIYAAKSTQDKHRSIDTQIEDCLRKAEEEGWEVIWKEVRNGEPIPFSDEKFSAYSGNRGEDLRKAKELAVTVAQERGEVCMLLAQASDRFARGEGDKPGAADALIEIWHQLRRQNVHLRSVDDDGDLRDSPSVANLGHRAMMESKRKSGAVKKGMARRAARGKPIGSTDPLGYRIGPEGYEPIAAEALIVDRIFRELRAGAKQLGIARNLNREGVPSKSGGKWYQGTIRRVAHNPIYKGMVVHRGEVLPGAHKPIIDPVLWEEVNALLTALADQHGAGDGRGRPSVGRHLFRKGMLRCKNGHLMLPRTTRKQLTDGTESLYEVYICSERVRDVATCSMLPVKRAEVDLSVCRYFEQVGLDVAATRKQLEESRSARLTETRSLFDGAETTAARAEANLARVRSDYKQGKITARDWSDFSGELSAELEAARSEVDRLAVRLQEIEEWSASQDAERDVLAKLADIRKAMAGEINEAAGTESLRAALLRLFEGFALRELQEGERLHVDLLQRGAGLVLDPIPRPQAIEGYTENMMPIFRRGPLYDAGNKYAPGFAAA